MTERKFGISGFILKCFAMLCMLIDHTGAILFPQYMQLRIVGRLAFPIYCFLLVEGAMHTKDIRKYERRLFIFALFSELPFDLAFYRSVDFRHQNVFFTLFLGLIIVDLYQNCKNRWIVCALSFLGLVLAEFLRTDYGAGGIIIIICFYCLYQYFFIRQVAFAVINLALFGITIQAYAGFATIPLLLYNGKKGVSMKYFFYIFYPAHLLILYIICKIMYLS